jgi:hypothetical protein
VADQTAASISCQSTNPTKDNAIITPNITSIDSRIRRRYGNSFHGSSKRLFLRVCVGASDATTTNGVVVQAFPLLMSLLFTAMSNTSLRTNTVLVGWDGMSPSFDR